MKRSSWLLPQRWHVSAPRRSLASLLPTLRLDHRRPFSVNPSSTDNVFLHAFIRVGMSVRLCIDRYSRLVRYSRGI